MEKININEWENVVKKEIYNYFNTYAVFDDSGKKVDIMQCISKLSAEDPKNIVLGSLYTVQHDYIQGVGKYDISVYDDLAGELENTLIDQFYNINKKSFGEDLESFADYFLSEHTILLKTYIYDILDNITPQKLKEIIF